MTVEELIAKLSEMPPDIPVNIGHDEDSGRKETPILDVYLAEDGEAVWVDF